MPAGIPDLDTLLARLPGIATMDARALEAEHTAILGRKAGALTALSRTIPTLPPEQRRAVGAALNQA
jgi:hypothetical protein